MVFEEIYAEDEVVEKRNQRLKNRSRLEATRAQGKIKQQQKLCQTFTQQYESSVQLIIWMSTADIIDRLDSSRGVTDQFTRIGTAIAALACVIAPLSLLVGVFGMNLKEITGDAANIAILDFLKIGLPVVILMVVCIAVFATWVLDSSRTEAIKKKTTMAKIETPRLNGSVLDFGLGSMQGSSSKSMAEIEELELCLEYIGEQVALGGEDEGSKVDDGNEALESEAGQEGTTLAKIKRPTPVCPAPEPTAANTFAPEPKKIQTAACLIVGDEVLGGKTNSNYMAKLCFEIGIDLRKVEVVPDDESEIIDAILRMSSKYDFVVTSGGIGPTHDDVTFPALAKAFGLKLELNHEAYGRMKRLMKPRPGEPPLNWDVDSVIRRANTRMVVLPTDPSIPPEEQFLFNVDALWAPVTV
ncbi:hypothetical protein V491_01815, partial [Pseudogymnoascus sp. VKM F-3775]